MLARILMGCAIVALAACNGAGNAAGGREAKLSGVSGTRDFPLTGFDKVELRGADNVTVRVGPAFSVSATGDSAILDKLEILVENGRLRIGRQKGNWNWSGDKGYATVTVTLPALVAASVAGSGDMKVDAVRTPRFAGSVAGSGDLTVGRLQAEDAVFSVAGSGDLNVAGTARTAKYSIAGSGDIAADGLASETISASIAGSGNIAAAARDAADVSIVGSGDVSIKGRPKCSVSKLGSGDVTCGA
ncbi:head GIN domain-containing protein [Sphingomonas sp. 1P06PA]|uniref:head GIN domain-containing protein n=1 Tax=Sphingomonas sp. 1P06PA TaxID=554121 RepID=UPI0039A440E1